MNRPDLDQRLRRELRDLRAEPSPALRGRILAALDAAPDRASIAPSIDSASDATAAVRRYPTWLAGLAAGLLALVALRATRGRESAPTPEPVPTVALAETLTDSAAEMESNLFAQADLLAEDARRAATSLLERMPSAPWGAPDGRALIRSSAR